MNHQAPIFLAVLITLFLGASEPMMSEKPTTQKQIRDAMTAEWENAAQAMADRERMSQAQRIQFAANCQNRVIEITENQAGNMTGGTNRHAAAIFAAFDDLFTGGRYSERAG